LQSLRPNQYVLLDFSLNRLDKMLARMRPSWKETSQR